MNPSTIHNEFGYFGKLPTRGDFVQQILPGDFVNAFHEWLQSSMAAARDRLGEPFLTHYLNCPAWKFLIAPGVCGLQGVTGVTIPSVDQVGRYFNFTLATVLQSDWDPISYVCANRTGFRRLEKLALDILESDFAKDEMDARIQDIAFEFVPVAPHRSRVEPSPDHLYLSVDTCLPFTDQADILLTRLLRDSLGDFSIWWHGQEGQTQSNMVVCRGMPAFDEYIRLLTRESPEPTRAEETDFIDQIISGEA